MVDVVLLTFTVAVIQVEIVKYAVVVIHCKFVARVILSITNAVALHNTHGHKDLERKHE